MSYSVDHDDFSETDNEALSHYWPQSASLDCGPILGHVNNAASSTSTIYINHPQREVNDAGPSPLEEKRLKKGTLFLATREP